MTQFIQLHLLTSYPPSNLNRDDLGRPKTAMMGGKQRLRVSSQSLKRAWRTSELFEDALKGHIGTRTKEVGRRTYLKLKELGMKLADAKKASGAIAEVFGKIKKGDDKGEFDGLDTEQLVHFSPEEFAAVDDLVSKLAAESRQPEPKELALLKKKHRAADIALFGRMVAANTQYNMDAAAQVAHAITVHETAVEEDFFSAVDDLNLRAEENDDAGAGHLGETEFGAGLYYLYICIDRDLLVRNLDGDERLAETTLRALTQTACQVAPGGKQATFGSRAWAAYVLAEKGEVQPRSLSVAFLDAVQRGNFLHEAVARLQQARNNMNTAYGVTGLHSLVFEPFEGKGTFEGLLDFVSAPGGTLDA